MNRKFAIIGLATVLVATTVRAATLTVNIEHLWRDRPVQFHNLCLTNASGNVLSITRLAYLLSGIRLHTHTGQTLALGDQSSYIDPVAGRRSFTLTNLPAGRFTNLSFNIGLAPALNHRDPSICPASHPLNPAVNGLHWSWQQGYVFFALEGHYRRPEAAQGGYSFHI